MEVDNHAFLAAQTYHRHQVPARRLRGVGPVPRPRRDPHLPAAAAHPRAPVRRGRFRHGPDRRVRREDDRGRIAARPRGVPVASGLVPLAGRAPPGPGHRGPLPALVHRQRPARRQRGARGPGPHGQLPRDAAPGAPGPEPVGRGRSRPARDDGVLGRRRSDRGAGRRGRTPGDPAGGRRSASAGTSGSRWRSARSSRSTPAPPCPLGPAGSWPSNGTWTAPARSPSGTRRTAPRRRRRRSGTATPRPGPTSPPPGWSPTATVTEPPPTPASRTWPAVRVIVSAS